MGRRVSRSMRCIVGEVPVRPAPSWTHSATPIRFLGSPLVTVNDFTVLGPRTLPAGVWVFGFAVDANRNGQYDGSFIDTVEVTVK